MSKKKKIIVLSCMIALLAITAIANVLFMGNNQNTIESQATSSTSNYFTQYRSERNVNRSEELLQLDAVIASATTDSVELSEALTMKTELTKITEKEFLLENLIKAYGFEDVVVVIGIDSDNVNVIAKTDELTTDDAILIYTIIQEESAISPENVKIIPIS